MTTALDTGRDAPFTGVVALDGPSGTGKSTVARLLAQRLGCRYLDTGAMYRAATVAALRSSLITDSDAAGVDAIVQARLADAVARAQIDISTNPAPTQVWLDGADISEEIRSARTTGLVSVVAAVPAVRTILVAAQRRLIEDGAIVVEGRDIGTVVWPAARPKVFLTANAAERARRRAGELGANADVDVVEADLVRRDRFDSSRQDSPLLAATDAVELDTSGLSIDQVVERLVDLTLHAPVSHSR